MIPPTRARTLSFPHWIAGRNRDVSRQFLATHTMKITPAHYSHIRAAMAPLTSKAIAHREVIKSDPRVGDLEKRLRWDWLYAAVHSRWVCDNIYPYADDTHLDTALRRIVGELLANPSLPDSLS